MQLEQERIALGERPTLNVRHLDGGTAPAFLLVHGLASNARLWDGVSRRLAQRGHRVVAVDQRGHGRSDGGEVDHRYDTAAGDLLALVEAMDLGRPVLVGQSWGGNVALETAARHGGAFRAVAAVDGGFIDVAAAHPDPDRAWEALRPPALAGRSAEEVRTMVAAHVEGWPPGSVEAQMANFRVAADGTIRPRLSTERHEHIVRTMWATDPLVAMAQVDMPALLLPVEGGRADWATTKADSVARSVEALPHGEVRWLQGDHDVHLQHPDVVATALAELATGVTA